MNVIILAELQRVLAYVERDLLQTVARPVKSPFGDLEPALKLVDAKDIASPAQARETSCIIPRKAAC